MLGANNPSFSLPEVAIPRSEKSSSSSSLRSFPSKPKVRPPKSPALTSSSSFSSSCSSSSSSSSSSSPFSSSSSSPFSTSSSPFSSSSPIIASSVDEFASLFTRFLRAEGAGLALWEEAISDGKEDFPRHFYTLCSHSPQVSRLGFLSITPSPFLLDQSCFPLETHFSFFLHTVGHTYLHSSIGTFASLLETTLSESAEIPFEHMFTTLMKIVFYSSLEISEKLSEAYGDVVSRADAPSHIKEGFFMKTFFFNFLGSCLEQPHVILSAPSLSNETIACCAHFSKVLRAIVSYCLAASPNKEDVPLPIFIPQNEEQNRCFVQNLQAQLQSFSSFILFEGGGGRAEDGCEEREGTEKQLWDGMRLFYLPLWEDHNIPCHRKGSGGKEIGGINTCSMKEPTPLESFKFLAEYLETKMSVIRTKVEAKSKMGEWSLDGEAVGEFGDWMMKKESEQGFGKQMEGGKTSPSLFNSSAGTFTFSGEVPSSPCMSCSFLDGDFSSLSLQVCESEDLAAKSEEVDLPFLS